MKTDGKLSQKQSQKLKDKGVSMTLQQAFNCLEMSMKWQNGFTKVRSLQKFIGVWGNTLILKGCYNRKLHRGRAQWSIKVGNWKPRKESWIQIYTLFIGTFSQKLGQKMKMDFRLRNVMRWILHNHNHYRVSGRSRILCHSKQICRINFGSWPITLCRKFLELCIPMSK